MAEGERERKRVKIKYYLFINFVIGFKVAFGPRHDMDVDMVDRLTGRPPVLHRKSNRRSLEMLLNHARHLGERRRRRRRRRRKTRWEVEEAGVKGCGRRRRGRRGRRGRRVYLLSAEPHISDLLSGQFRESRCPPLWGDENMA